MLTFRCWCALNPIPAFSLPLFLYLNIWSKRRDKWDSNSGTKLSKRLFTVWSQPRRWHLLPIQGFPFCNDSIFASAKETWPIYQSHFQLCSCFTWNSAAASISAQLWLQLLVKCKHSHLARNVPIAMPIFRVKSLKIYTGQKKFTRTPSVAYLTNMRYEFSLSLMNRFGRKWETFMNVPRKDERGR